MDAVTMLIKSFAKSVLDTIEKADQAEEAQKKLARLEEVCRRLAHKLIHESKIMLDIDTGQNEFLQMCEILGINPEGIPADERIKRATRH